ncbi:hypothetical protein Plhal304r1_c042g0121971 [Plasmopara halstedii]
MRSPSCSSSVICSTGRFECCHAVVASYLLLYSDTYVCEQELPLEKTFSWR